MTFLRYISAFFLAFSAFLGCNPDKGADDRVDVPVIIGPWPDGDPGVFHIIAGETLSISVLYTPSQASTAIWYVDGIEYGRGKDFSFTVGKEGTYRLRLEVSNRSGIAFKEAIIMVASPSAPVLFGIEKGVNIGNWLSQSKVRGSDRDKAFMEKHVRLIAEAGFDHIRLPVDEEQLFKEDGSVDRETLSLVKRTIDNCAKAGLRVLFDLHIIRSHHFDNSDNPLWTDTREQDKLLDMWRMIDEELKSYPADILAYDFLNEPVAPDVETWNNLYNRFIAQVRKTDKERVLVIESNRWGGSKYVSKMKFPDDDPNLMIQIHYYEPHFMTSYLASWGKFADIKFDTPMTYPGNLISDAQYNSLSEEQKALVLPYRRYYDRSTIVSAWKDAVDFAGKKGIRLYLGEFGCLPNCGVANRNAWTKDVVSVCREYGMPYSYWEYNRSYGFADKNGEIIYPDILEILVSKK